MDLTEIWYGLGFIFALLEVLNMVNVLHYSLMECDVQSGRQVLLQKNLLFFFFAR